MGRHVRQGKEMRFFGLLFPVHLPLSCANVDSAILEQAVKFSINEFKN